MRVLSVDLASRHYRDNGIALLEGAPGRVQARVLSADALGLRARPKPEAFAAALHTLAQREDVRLILLDGPQGWRANRSPLQHLRHCEREARTPGKTGLPGIVKPATWTRMANFSIALFSALDSLGWPRITRGWSGERAAIESFPTQAWRCLGHPTLPAKTNQLDLTPWIHYLGESGVQHLPDPLTHDDIQALVAGLAGVQLLHAGLSACTVYGEDPFTEDETWREGLIICPRPSTR